MRIQVDPALIPLIGESYTDELARKLRHLRPSVREELQTALKAVDEEEARLLRIHHAFPPPPEWEALYSADEPAQLPTVEALLEPEVMTRFNAYSEAMHELTDPDSDGLGRGRCQRGAAHLPGALGTGAVAH